MSERRKLGPVRQLSLQSDVRRPLLKKQLSVEHLEHIEEHKLPFNRLSDRPRTVKVAWAENTVEIKKCKEFKRPVTAKEPRMRTQLSLDSKSIEKESILYTRQELAERLRKAWKERVENKQNLDIFLGNNLQDKPEENYEPIKPNIAEEVVQNKKPQKIQKQKTVASEFNYVPRPLNISVTIPIVMNSQPNSLEVKHEPEKPKLVKQVSLINKENESVAKQLPQRPSTAASKRESFQKRTNTAFTSTTPFRPPLNRALSTPIKSDGQKLKFIASKRRIKSARKKINEDIISGDENEDKEKKKGSRCRSATGELVTMVSLVSPAGSDTEEQESKEIKKEEPSSSKKITKSGIEITLKQWVAMRDTRTPIVSFQQSSIHTVRSFSASFPSRRQVMSLSSGATGAMAAEREKRAPVESPPGPGDSRRPKRRLVRAVSVGGEAGSTSSFNEDKELRSKSPPGSPESPKQIISGVTRAEILPSTKKQDSIEKKPEDIKNNENTVDPSIPKFESNKERECWVMYKKMSEKGLPVSYDTILRGMLTPTEYRSVRKEIKLI